MAKTDGVAPVCHSSYYPGRVEVLAEIGGPSLTCQEFTDECDINQVMARYDKGILPDPRFAQREPLYVDFSNQPRDLQEAMMMMMDADEAFMRLPALVRKEFDNDPLRFVEFASNGENVEKLREWGLAEPEKAPDAPMRVEVVNPAPAAPPPADKASS